MFHRNDSVNNTGKASIRVVVTFGDDDDITMKNSAQDRLGNKQVAAGMVLVVEKIVSVDDVDRLLLI
jgi:hypothetical protein